jgi:hypothetical protein
MRRWVAGALLLLLAALWLPGAVQADHLGFSVRLDSVEYRPDGTSVWSYSVVADGATHGLSHVVIGTCPTGYPGNLTTDPVTGLTGVKWEVPGDFRDGTYGPLTITLNGWYQAGTVGWAVKAGAEASGGGVDLGTVEGASCDLLPPELPPTGSAGWPYLLGGLAMSAAGLCLLRRRESAVR